MSLAYSLPIGLARRVHLAEIVRRTVNLEAINLVATAESFAAPYKTPIIRPIAFTRKLRQKWTRSRHLRTAPSV